MFTSLLAAYVSSLMLLGGISARTPDGHTVLIEKVQSLPASQVDTTQNDIPLKAWLTELVGPDADTTWQVSSCDLKPDYSTPEESWPLCVEFVGRRKGSLGVRLHIDLGTFGSPNLANAKVHRQSLAWWWCLECDRETAAKQCTIIGIDSLGGMVAARDKLRDRPECK
jgi:hypothetical protein